MKNNKKVNIKRRLSYFGRIGHKFHQGSKHTIKKLQSERRIFCYWYFSIRLFGKVLLKFDSVLRYLGIIKNSIVSPEKDSIDLIYRTYEKDNLMLQKILKNYNLKKYGYFKPLQ